MNNQITASHHPLKKTFNIEFQNVKDMEAFIAPRKQTAFVNKAIRASLDQLMKEKEKQEAIESLEKLYSMRVKSDESAVDLVRAIRHERADRLVDEMGKDAG